MENLVADNYVGVDNLLPNKQGKKSSTYVPSKGVAIQYLRDDILIGNIRPYLKKIWLATNDGGTNGDVLVLRLRDEYKSIISPRYLFQLLSSDAFFDFDTQYSKGVKMPRGDKASVMQYLVPVPSIERQVSVVTILEKFAVLVGDLSNGLPAEIDARRQQYTYYQNKLLTF